MRTKMALIIAVIICCQAYAQPHKNEVLWGFPLTDYMKPLNDSITIVQVLLPPQIKFKPDAQLGLLRGIYRGNDNDTGRKGWGKCHLIKGDYNYFTVHIDDGKAAQQDDLLYTFIKAPEGGYQSTLFFCASNNITFLTVQDSAFFTPGNFLFKRTEAEDEKLLDLMVEDIHFTGKYFLENNNSMNKAIEDGPFKGGHVLDEMVKTKKSDLVNFLRYVVARNVRYAGNKWKISETYATWLVSGAPMVVDN